MFTYKIKNHRQIQEQAYMYIEETTSGVFNITKNRYGNRNVSITSKEVAEALKNGESVAFLDIYKNIHTNFIPVLRKFDDTLSRFQEDNSTILKNVATMGAAEARQQLSDMTRDVRKQKAQENYHPTHVVFIADEGEGAMHSLFCFEEQVDDIKNFLQDRIGTAIITELGRDLVRIQNVE